MCQGRRAHGAAYHAAGTFCRPWETPRRPAAAGGGAAATALTCRPLPCYCRCPATAAADLPLRSDVTFDSATGISTAALPLLRQLNQTVINAPWQKKADETGADAATAPASDDDGSSSSSTPADADAAEPPVEKQDGPPATATGGSNATASVGGSSSMLELFSGTADGAGSSSSTASSGSGSGLMQVVAKATAVAGEPALGEAWSLPEPQLPQGGWVRG